MSDTTHIIDTRQFKDRQFLSQFIDRSQQMSRDVRRGKIDRKHAGKIVASLFYEPSTRTKLSFDAAAKRLGADVIGTENAGEFSSAKKGETLEHSILATQDLYDALIIRHPQDYAAARAAAVSKKPVVNAGDGSNQHPTQALLDIYTIAELFGQIDNLRVGFVGDIKHGRTVRSLTYILSQLDNHRLYFIAPKELGLTPDMREHLEEKKTRFEEHAYLDAVISKLDVLYVTRLQLERVPDRETQERLLRDYRQNQITYTMANRMHRDAVIMHPMPINTEKSDGFPEITSDVDEHPRARYLQQSNNGQYVRMALLDILLAPTESRDIRKLILPPPSYPTLA